MYMEFVITVLILCRECKCVSCKSWECCSTLAVSTLLLV